MNGANVNGHGSRGTAADWPAVHREDPSPEMTAVAWLTAILVAAGLVLLVKQERNQSRNKHHGN